MAIVSLTGCTNAEILSLVKYNCVVDPPPRPPKDVYHFNVELSYDIEGTNVVDKDTIVCRYKGEKDIVMRCINHWDQTLLSGREVIILKEFANKDFVFYPTEGCETLSAGTFQNKSIRTEKNNPDRDLNEEAFLNTVRDKTWRRSRIKNNELLEKYNIKINNYSVNEKP